MRTGGGDEDEVLDTSPGKIHAVAGRPEGLGSAVVQTAQRDDSKHKDDKLNGSWKFGLYLNWRLRSPRLPPSSADRGGRFQETKVHHFRK